MSIYRPSLTVFFALILLVGPSIWTSRALSQDQQENQQQEAQQQENQQQDNQQQDNQQQDNQQQRINIDFPDGISLKTFMDIVSNQTDRRFIVDAERGLTESQVQIQSPQPIPLEGLFPMFLQMLQLKGLAANEQEIAGEDETVYRIVEAERPEPVPSVGDDEELPENQSIVSRVYRLEHADAEQAKVAIQNLVTQRAQGVMEIQTVNSLIVTDYAPNIRYISDIIEMMDAARPGPQFRVINLEHTNKDQVVPTLQDLTQDLMQRDQNQNNRPGEPVEPSFAEHPAKNAIVATAMEEDMAQIVNVVNQLDIEVEDPPSAIHTYRLDNADATEVAEMLTSLYEDRQISDGSDGGGEGGRSGTGVVQEQVPNIEAFEQRNELIVAARESLWQNEIEPILEDLDRQPVQVLLGATIVEVSGTMRNERGVELATIDSPADSPRGFGSTALGLSELVTNNQGIPIGRTPSPDLSGGIFGVFKEQRDRIPVLANLFERDQIINISQLPYIVTNDNQSANLSVTDEVPTQSTDRGDDVTTTSFDGFEEAGVEMNITPHIAEEHYLRLEVETIFSEFEGESPAEGVPPSKISREISTAMTIPDRQTVIMGGLTSNIEDDNTQGTPYFNDIPGLGLLFESRQNEIRETTLYVFLTPYVMRDDEFLDLRNESRQKKITAQELTELDIGEPDPRTNINGALDLFTIHSPYTRAERNRILEKYGDLLKPLSSQPGTQQSNR